MLNSSPIAPERPTGCVRYKLSKVKIPFSRYSDIRMILCSASSELQDGIGQMQQLHIATKPHYLVLKH